MLGADSTWPWEVRGVLSVIFLQFIRFSLKKKTHSIYIWNINTHQGEKFSLRALIWTIPILDCFFLCLCFPLLIDGSHSQPTTR